MAFVLDASVTASWAFPDGNHPHATAALSRIQHETAEAPGLWWYELRNILIVNERRGRITAAETRAFLDRILRLPIILDHSPIELEVLSLARRHGLSVYDAAYLELAMRKACSIATLDQALVRASQAEAVRLVTN